MIEKSPSKKGFRAMFIFYILIAFEILYMISPFGIYYYSVYGKGLNFLNANPVLKWLSSFFLPHIATTTSPLLNSVKIVGWILASLGFTAFCIGAVQIYWGKFRRKGAITGGIYNFIRHPQYSSLIVCSFGLLLVWPRFLVLFMFATMIFVYYFLARSEERECEQKFGESYRAYREKTSMFFPLLLKKKINLPSLPEKGIKRKLLILAIYLATMSIVLGGSFLIRNSAMKSLSAYSSENQITVSINNQPEEVIREALQIAAADTNVQSILNKNEGPYLNYLMPSSWYFSDIPMEIPKGKEGHYQNRDYDPKMLKILITSAKLKENSTAAEGYDIIRRTRTNSPVAMIYIDMNSRAVTKVEEQHVSLRWGDIPVPLY